jgi:3-hydroxymyristoyl/3-hydroxydecanoyl-(acyl carrier protein) dehydratase
MRFLFVDRVTETGATASAASLPFIRGEKRFALDAPLRYPDAPGLAPEIAPGAVAEALGQLASWLMLARNDFTARPVFWFAERIAILGPTPPGELVTMEARLDQVESEGGEEGAGATFTFSGEAYVQGRKVVQIERCTGGCMPLADLEDPVTAKQRWALLNGGGLVLTGDGGQLDFAALAGEVAALAPGKRIVSRLTMPLDAPFYADHFPRMPVTPIVVINEAIGRVAAQLITPEQPRLLRAKAAEGVKIRSFVRPGESIDVKVEVLERGRRIHRVGGDGTPLTTRAEVVKDDRIVLRGVYKYELAEA